MQQVNLGSGTPETGTAEHVELELDGFTFGIATLEAAQAHHGLRSQGEGCGIEIVAWTDRADAAVETLVAKGAPPLSPLHDFLDGKLPAAWIADPDNKPVQLVERQDQSWREFPRAGTMVTIYGITNCDTMKKARAWLDAHQVAYAFHDYKASGIDKATLADWAEALGWDTLLNRAGTTFRKLPDSDKHGVTEKKALALMLAQPSLIKRPVLDTGRTLVVGFKPESYAAVFR